MPEANKELEAFSYSVSHDLRAPLRHIHGFVEILRESLEKNSEEAVYLDRIDGAVDDMSALIKSLLEFSRAGLVPLQREKVNMEKLVAEGKKFADL